MTRSPLDTIERTCKAVRITSKETGVTPLWPLWGTQQYYLDCIGRGLEDDIRSHCFIKGRQDGITTIGVTLDVHWMNHVPGLQGEMIFDADDNKTYFRDIITQIVNSIPKNLRRKVRMDNRAGLIFEGPSATPYAVSRLMYQVYGKGKSAAASLGTGRGLNYFHGTEVGGWGGDDVAPALANFRASLSQGFPMRLYVYEGTPRGYNHLYDLYHDFAKSRFLRAHFIGWWRNEHRRFRAGTLQYAAYGDPALSEEERFWTGRVKQEYGVTIDREQLAWWRYMLEEEIRTEASMYEQYPPIVELGWQATGSMFITPKTMNELELRVRSRKATACGWYTYRFGSSVIEDLDVVDCDPEAATLTIWEPPRDGARYVVGADPAYGSSQKADRSCASVWRVAGHGLIQVAEFLSPSPVAYEFAWVLAHLCGYYYTNYEHPPVLTLEITGPGEAVYLELQRMASYGWGQRVPGRAIQDAVANIRHYLYRRADAATGITNTMHWKSTGSKKERVMNNLRDMLERGALGVRSPALVQELRSLRQSGTTIEGHGRAHDDTCIAAALACEGFYTHIVPELSEDTEGVPVEMIEAQPPPTVLGETLKGFMQGLGRRQGLFA